MSHAKEYYMKQMKPLMKFFYYTGCIKLYKNGDGVGFVWRWWNPLCIAIVPVIFLINILIVGIPETFKYKDGLGVGVSPFFKKYPEKLEWL